MSNGRYGYTRVRTAFESWRPPYPIVFAGRDSGDTKAPDFLKSAAHRLLKIPAVLRVMGGGRSRLRLSIKA
jgi:hypothetical protein